MDSHRASFVLSSQEERVIALSMEGLGDKEIAHALGLSFSTVRTYWKRIQTKIGGNTRAEVVASFARKGPELQLKVERALNERLQEEIAYRRAAEEKFRAVCACAPIGIYVSNVDGDCFYVNPAWERITGLPAASTMGSDWEKIVHPDDLEALIEWWEIQKKSNVSSPTEFRFLSSRGVIRVRTTFSRMEVDGRIVGYVGTIEQLSDRRPDGAAV